MIKQLRVRLTVLFTILTSLIFIGMTLSTWYMAMSWSVADMQNNFSSAVDYIKGHISSTKILRDSWLSEQEIAGNLIIYIEDETRPLHYKGLSNSVMNRDILISQAKSKAINYPSMIPSMNYFYSIKDDNQTSYLCSQTYISMPNNHYVTLWVIRTDFSPKQFFLDTFPIYTFIIIAGCILLAIVCFLMVRLATSPVKESIRRQNEFIAAASHELRSPLAVIKATLAADKLTTEYSEHLRLLGSVEREADRLSHLTDNLLLLTGHDAKTKTPNKTQLSPDTMLIEIYETFVPLCSQQKHSLTINLPDKELPQINADSESITQLLGILIHNAITYTPNDTLIELTAIASHNSVIISVIDHGPGIPDADKKNVFQRFYRRDQSRTDKNHYGLGLSVASEIAHAHGSFIELTDTPGGGATFRLKLSR